MRRDRHPAAPLQQPSARSLDQASQAASELTGDLLVRTLLALIVDGLQQVGDGRRLKRVGVGVVRDSLKGVDPAERLLKNQGLGIGQSRQQLPEQGEDGELPIGTRPGRAAWAEGKGIRDLRRRWADRLDVDADRPSQLPIYALAIRD